LLDLDFDPLSAKNVEEDFSDPLKCSRRKTSVNVESIGSDGTHPETPETGLQTRLHAGLQDLTQLVDKRRRELQVELAVRTPEVSIDFQEFHELAPDHQKDHFQTILPKRREPAAGR
jgi:hypothetical protein